MGLFDLFKGGEGERRSKPKSSPAAKWADRVEKRAQNYDRQEAIQALAEMATPDAVEVLLKRFTFHMDPSITDQEEKDVGVPRHPARRRRTPSSRAGVRRQGREPRVADEDHEGARRRGRVRRGAPALALAVGHRVRQVRRPEGADPRGARGAPAPAHPRRGRALPRGRERACALPRRHRRSCAGRRRGGARRSRTCSVDEESVRVRTKIAEGLASRGWPVPEDERERRAQGAPARPTRSTARARVDEAHERAARLGSARGSLAPTR